MAHSFSRFGKNASPDTSPNDLLKYLVTDLQSGKEPNSLRAPPTCSISMTTLSRESLIPVQVTSRKRFLEQDDQHPSVHHALASTPPSDYSSSIYSDRSFAGAGTESESEEPTVSSFLTDEILKPKPLDLSRITSLKPANYPPDAFAEDTSSKGEESPDAMAISPDPPRPNSMMQAHTYLEGEFEALIKEIVRYPIIESSPTCQLIQMPPQSPHFLVNQKAARVLGLDGAGSPITPTAPILPGVLKDVTNKETTSSPRTLRNIASKLSLSGRKKSLQQEKEATALGKIEERVSSKFSGMVQEVDKSRKASGSISRRRGFRPLSIHTGKAFDPFSFGGSPESDPKKTTRTSNYAPDTIEADFATLVSSSPPNIRHHPAFQRDPFSAKSPIPLLKTTSSPLEIRENRDRSTLGQNSSKRSSGESKESSGGSKKKFLFDSGLTAPIDGDGAYPLDLILGGSPLPRTRPFATLRESLSTAATKDGEPRNSTSSDINAASIDSSCRSRGISSWFRQHDKSADPSSKDSGIADRTPQVEAARDAQVAFLRNLYNVPNPDYDPNDPYPRHPITGRSWNARNLKCTNCHDHLCSCCGMSCCTYRQSCVALGNPLSKAQIKEQALRRMDQINRVFPDGKELPTFLQCTNGDGCGKYVCPECIGMCPLSICRDTQCKGCKKDQWAVCDFHDEEQIQFCQDNTT